MKIKSILLALVAFGTIAAYAQTNTLNISTNIESASKSEPWTVEMTLGGGSIYVPSSGDSETAVDFSVSVNPFEKAPSVWVGVAQSLAWEPTFAGSTDLYVDYSWHIVGDLWLNTGWSVGAVYDTDSFKGSDSSEYWRTGPEAILQYYIGDSAFIYGGANYDLARWGDNVEKSTGGDNPLRFSWGVGFTF